MTTVHVPDWAELLIRMRLAAAPALRGVMRVAEMVEPTGGQAMMTERIRRVFFRPPGRLRVEDELGAVVLIADDTTCWSVTDGVAEPVARRRCAARDEAYALLRPAPSDASFRDPEDFHQPITEPVATTWLGRPCWRVTFAPTERKPHLLTVWVDAEHGFLLRMAAGAEEGPGSAPFYLHEFVDLAVGVELEAGLFRWDGPVDDALAEQEQAYARAVAHARTNPPAVPRYWPYGLPWDLDDGDPASGAWTVSLEVPGPRSGDRGWARLDRRPLEARPYQPRTADVHRWVDARWQWALETTCPLDQTQVEAIIASIPVELIPVEVPAADA